MSRGTYLTWKATGILILIVALIILGYYTYILLNAITMVLFLGVVSILVYFFALHLWRNRR